jgi:hypothetical protein
VRAEDARLLRLLRIEEIAGLQEQAAADLGLPDLGT